MNENNKTDLDVRPLLLGLGKVVDEGVVAVCLVVGDVVVDGGVIVVGGIGNEGTIP